MSPNQPRRVGEAAGIGHRGTGRYEVQGIAHDVGEDQRKDRGRVGGRRQPPALAPLEPLPDDVHGIDGHATPEQGGVGGGEVLERKGRER